MSMYLFVGGPVDGRLFDIEPRQPIIYMPVPVDVRAPYLPATVPEKVEYRLMAFAGERMRFELYSCVGPDDVLAKLISRYGEER